MRQKKLKHYLDADIHILDEPDFKKMPSHNADDFFEMISKRYERGSVIKSRHVKNKDLTPLMQI